MFRKLLIANRGEIACRVARTARRLAIPTVAVYSEADAEAPHVRAADEAVPIGPPAPRESYLAIERIVAAALATGANAVHPGYGFLSENADFARACGEAGLTFVGPPVAAIEAMGSKSAAKTLMAEAGVPLVPGYHGAEQSEEALAAAAERIGFPVLLKASAGGGGRGMRVVERPSDLAAAIQAAKRESAAAFGDDRLLIERYLERPRHVEVQVFADGHGTVLHLFERDCSVQRRHQKVIEEAPAPGLDAERRAAIGAAAVAAARAVGYVGAGTVEFLMEPSGAFHFMEMNTRLQVEHPVTEMITGLDLVEWQLRVAAGERLPEDWAQLRPKGHAVEVRLYAEDPERGFLPQTGRIARLRFPAGDGHVRIDAGIAEGGQVSVHYDPMIAKVIAWDADRTGALRRLARALAETDVVGVTTNLAFLRRLVEHPAFAAADLDTGFIARHSGDLLGPPAPAGDRALALAALAVMARREAEAAASAARSLDPHSPWHAVDGWRLNDDNHHRLVLRERDGEHAVVVHFRRGGYRLDLPGGSREAAGRLAADGTLEAVLDGHRVVARAIFVGGELTLADGAQTHAFTVVDPLHVEVEAEGEDGRLTAPMPGRVVRVLVEPGAAVTEGAALIVVEAMKMEHTILAPADGVVEAVHFMAGDQVEEGVPLISFTAREGA